MSNLDGLVLDDRVTYIGVGRDPRDVAVSMIMDWGGCTLCATSYLRTVGLPAPRPSRLRVSPLEAFQEWMELPAMPTVGGRPGTWDTSVNPEPRSGIWVSLATILHHLESVWHRRHLPNVAAFHYSGYQIDLVGELVRLAQVLGYSLTRERAEELAGHASPDAMRARASELAPDQGHGIRHSNDPFFRAGSRGSWREIFTEAEYKRYGERTGELVSPDLLAWAHDGRRGCEPAT